MTEFADLCAGCGDSFSSQYPVIWWRLFHENGTTTGWARARVGEVIHALPTDIVEFSHGNCVEEVTA